MNLLSVENITKNFGDKLLFTITSFGIEQGEKIGVIGVNGTGKSTLLKILVGVEQPDTGTIVVGNNVKIGYLPQEPAFNEDATVIEQVFNGNSPMIQVLKEYENTVEALKFNPASREDQKKLAVLSQQLDNIGAWQFENDAKTILTKLGISNFQRKVGSLSGGQRKRVALAGALINPVDLLVLDEPTNHIDSQAIVWLEEFLNKRKGALLMVTHDRYFLDRVTNRIIEIDNGKLYQYKGNYSCFLELKAERQEQMYASEKKRQNMLRRELAWLKRGAKARTTKQQARIERIEELKEMKNNIRPAKINISVASTRLGKKVIELEHISKSYGETKCIDDFSCTVLKNDRIGIIGPNGCGKTTLLKIMGGLLQPDSGRIERGETVKIGYFSQENIAMQETMRVIDYIKEEAEYIHIADGAKISASQMLDKFLFPPAVQYTHIGRLSGGEKRRLHLLRVLMGAPNVLFMDEPTNDLDTETLTILEDYLEQFAGTVIVASHDRYFLDRVVDKIFAFRDDGCITRHVGNYSDYQEFKRSETLHWENVNVNPSTGNRDKAEKKKEKPLRLSYQEQREYEQIEGVIEGLEAELADVGEQIDRAGSDYVLLQELLKRKEELEGELAEKMERWVYLNELVEYIARSKES